MTLLVFRGCFNSFGVSGSRETTGQLTSLVTGGSGSAAGVGHVINVCSNGSDSSNNGLGLSSDKQGGNGSSAFLGGMGLAENMLGGNGSGEEGADTYGEDTVQGGEGMILTPGDGDLGTASGTGSGHGT